MITNDLKIAAKELNEILKNMVPEEYIFKIPEKFREFLNEIEDKNYECKLDFEKNIDEQNITEKTKDLITVIYRNYWCTVEERNNLDIILTENEKRYQEELIKKYNPDELFKKKEEIRVDTSDNVSLIEYKKSTIFDKIKDFIKSIFKKKSSF